MTPSLLSDLSGFQRDLLYTVPVLEKPSGRVIKEEAERLFDRQVSHGLLYPNLNELVESELLAKGHLDMRTNYYELTPLGRELAERRSRWQCERLGLR